MKYAYIFSAMAVMATGVSADLFGISGAVFTLWTGKCTQIPRQARLTQQGTMGTATLWVPSKLSHTVTEVGKAV